jgi:hypothetical protein
MRNDANTKELADLDDYSEALRRDLKAVDEMLELYQQEAIALEQLEMEERELLVDLEYGGETGLERIVSRIKASFGLK